MRLKTLVFLALLLSAVLACGSFDSLPGLLQAPSPHDRYARSLTSAALDDTAVGRAWIDAGEQALEEALTVDLPLREVLFLDPLEPTALSYRFYLQRGQSLEAEIVPEEEVGGEAEVPRLFLDLFALELETSSPPRPVAHGEEAASLCFEVEEEGHYVLRLQPELLAGGRFTLSLHAGPTLAFPVSGRDSDAIGSLFGDPRDGGSRRHHGVDIFAPRGTEAVAAAAGFVTRVGSNRLGGNTVWMITSKRRLSLYYAHLERQLVSVGEHVEVGEPVGLVGSSGNAKTTPPHLHFGVYSGGPLDPYPFLHQPPPAPEVRADLERLGGWSRIRGARVRLRAGPGTRYEILGELPRHTAMSVRGATAGWFRVELPDGSPGYVSARLTEPARGAIRSRALEAPRSLRRLPSTAAPAVAELAAGERVAVLAVFGEHLYVEAVTSETEAGETGASETGWLVAEPASA